MPDLALLDNSGICVELGARIRAERVRKRLTQVELATSAALALRTYKRLESTGKGRIETLVAALRALERIRALDIALPQPALTRREPGVIERIRVRAARVRKNI